MRALSPSVLRVRTVFGGFVHVRAADYDDSRRVMVRLCTREGVYYSDRLDRRGNVRSTRPGECAHICRENIAHVIRQGGTQDALPLR